MIKKCPFNAEIEIEIEQNLFTKITRPLIYADVELLQDLSVRAKNFNDIYFSSSVADNDNSGDISVGLQEKYYVFIVQNNLKERLNTFVNSSDNIIGLKNFFIVSEIGLGLGLNLLLTIEEFLNVHTLQTSPRKGLSEKILKYVVFEMCPFRAKDYENIIRSIIKDSERAHFLIEIYKMLAPVDEGNGNEAQIKSVFLKNLNVEILVFWGEINSVLEQEYVDVVLGNYFNYKSDVWYLDGFSPSKNIDMWSEDIFDFIKEHTVAGGTLSTYSTAGKIKNALTTRGFEIKKAPGLGLKKHILTAKCQL